MNDSERKVKQIIRDMKHTKGRNSTLEELMLCTGKDKKELQDIEKTRDQKKNELHLLLIHYLLRTSILNFYRS